MQLRRLIATAALAVTAATSLAACGAEEEVSRGLTEGVYVTTGEIAYQVQISRQLNAADFEDRDFLKGLPAGDRALGKGEEWFGVFLRAFNRTDRPHASAAEFVIRDTAGNEFRPVQLDNNNVVAYRPLVVKPGDQIPVPGSLARENTTQGGLVLFKVPVSSYDSRPLELTITSPEGGAPAVVDLDV